MISEFLHKVPVAPTVILELIVENMLVLVPRQVWIFLSLSLGSSGSAGGSGSGVNSAALVVRLLSCALWWSFRWSAGCGLTLWYLSWSGSEFLPPPPSPRWCHHLSCHPFSSVRVSLILLSKPHRPNCMTRPDASTHFQLFCKRWKLQQVFLGHLFISSARFAPGNAAFFVVCCLACKHLGHFQNFRRKAGSFWGLVSLQSASPSLFILWETWPPSLCCVKRLFLTRYCKYKFVSFVSINERISYYFEIKSKKQMRKLSKLWLAGDAIEAWTARCIIQSRRRKASCKLWQKQKKKKKNFWCTKLNHKRFTCVILEQSNTSMHHRKLHPLVQPTSWLN